MNIILFTLVALLVIAFIAIRMRRRSDESKTVIAEARMRSAERRTERAYLDTEPTEDPYERNYPLNGDTSGIEVNESASGYGTLTNEQKDVISAIFDSGPVTTKMLIKETGFECGNRWAGSVFGELNKVDPIPRNNI